MIIEVIQHHRTTSEKNLREISNHYGLAASDSQIESFMQCYDYTGLAETINNVVAWGKKRQHNDNSSTGLALYTY